MYFCWICRYLLWLKVQYKSLLQTWIILQNKIIVLQDIVFAFPEVNQCQKQLPALKIIKKTLLPVGRGLPSLSVLCTSPRLKLNNGKIIQSVHMKDFFFFGGVEVIQDIGQYPPHFWFSWDIAQTQKLLHSHTKKIWISHKCRNICEEEKWCICNEKIALKSDTCFNSVLSVVVNTPFLIGMDGSVRMIENFFRVHKNEISLACHQGSCSWRQPLCHGR